MNSEQRQLIKRFLDVLLRRGKIIIACLLLGVALGLAQYLTMPKVYQCTSMIKYQRQRVNPTAMSPDDVRTRVEDVVDTLGEQILSRTNLGDIIKHFDLYPGMRKRFPLEDVVDNMRKKYIKIKLLKGGNIFRLAYEGTDPEKVLQVTNTLAANFIEKNLRVRQAQASETSSYVNDELRMAKEGLDKKELVMRDYKLKYYNEMPAQKANNVNRLNALQQQYQNNQESSHELERTRLLVQEQISLRQELLGRSLAGAAAAGSTGSSLSPEGLDNIEQVRLRLQSLKARYTAAHPEVKRLKRILRDLEKQQYAKSGEGGSHPFDPQIEELHNQLNDLKFNLARLAKERLALAKEIKKYERWIAKTPVREAEWSALTRDYEQLNRYYQRLVTQSLHAESALSLEKQLKGSQFEIIEPAHFPEKPFKPDFLRIMLMAVGAGLGVGGALAFGLEFLSTSFKDPQDLESYLGLPIICAVPDIRTRKESIKRKIWQLAWYVVLFLAIGGIVLATAHFWNQGKIVL